MTGNSRHITSIISVSVTLLLLFSSIIAFGVTTNLKAGENEKNIAKAEIEIDGNAQRVGKVEIEAVKNTQRYEELSQKMTETNKSVKELQINSVKMLVILERLETKIEAIEK